MSNFQDLQRDYSMLANTIAGDPEAAMIFNRGLASFDALSEAEKSRFHWMISEPLKGAQTCFQLHRRDLIDRELYADYMASFFQLFRTPGVQEYWATSQHWWHTSFREFIEGELAGMPDSRESRPSPSSDS